MPALISEHAGLVAFYRCAPSCVCVKSRPCAWGVEARRYLGVGARAQQGRCDHLRELLGVSARLDEQPETVHLATARCDERGGLQDVFGLIALVSHCGGLG